MPTNLPDTILSENPLPKDADTIFTYFGSAPYRFRGELDRERDHARDLAGKLDTAHRAHSDEAARLRQEIDGLRSELARPWWRQLIGR
jgi:hypothetical protein